ncbi:MAG: mechanosensitive ion channel family protein [Lewinella sp.]|jgi:small conductance mechanosensitive channel|uniref:mechanosensitive ion channel family protein n=1 Tax=Lewinella sp. TaxID=2004506 RepID=UPI003D6A258B
MDFFDLDKLSELVTAYGTKVIGAVLTLIIGFWIVGRITSAMDKGMMKKGIDETIRPFLSSLVNVGLKVMLLLAAASMFGIETTSFIAIFSALAFAVGLALQGSLGHFASGVLLLTFRPYKVGDLVTIGGGETGTVKGIQIFNTVLVTLDNKHIIVPNGVVTSNVITNISGQGIIGVELTFGIGYNDSIDKAREIILAVGKECPWILDDPAQGVVVGELADSSVNLNTRPFCNSEHYWDTFFYMQEHVKKGFDAGGVSIPFPQMDVHMDK